jgi:predicted phosphodiesterase
VGEGHALRTIAVLADLHIGRRRTGHFDDPSADEALAGVLSRLADEVDRVFLLGDVLELYYGLIPFSSRNEERVIARHHPLLVSLLSQPRFVWFVGNHDLRGGSLRRPLGELMIEAAGHRTLFLHGHRYDRGIHRVPRVAELGAWAGGMAARLGVRHAVRWLTELNGRFNGVMPKTPVAETPYVRAAFDHAHAEGADTLIIGHIHHTFDLRRGGVHMLNPGPSSAEGLAVLYYDLQTGDHERRVIKP